MSSEENSRPLPAGGTAPEAQAESTNSTPTPAESAEVGDLLGSMESVPALDRGEIVQGRVVKITDEEVLVDVGLKCEGVIPRSEFLAENGQLTVALGAAVAAL